MMIESTSLIVLSLPLSSELRILQEDLFESFPTISLEPPDFYYDKKSSEVLSFKKKCSIGQIFVDMEQHRFELANVVIKKHTISTGGGKSRTYRNLSLRFSPEVFIRPVDRLKNIGRIRNRLQIFLNNMIWTGVKVFSNQFNHDKEMAGKKFLVIRPDAGEEDLLPAGVNYVRLVGRNINVRVIIK